MSRHLFIVSRNYPDFFTYLMERFADDPNVEVILDRRAARERRRRQDAVEVDRRVRDRRRQRALDEELETRSHVILTTD